MIIICFILFCLEHLYDIHVYIYIYIYIHIGYHHDMETHSALLVLCKENPTSADGLPSWRAWASFQKQFIHHNDVIISAMLSQIFSIVYLLQVQIKEDIKVPRHWPLGVKFTGNWWIPCTKGQLREKCFHLMKSSWLRMIWDAMTRMECHSNTLMAEQLNM